MSLVSWTHQYAKPQMERSGGYSEIICAKLEWWAREVLAGLRQTVVETLPLHGGIKYSMIGSQEKESEGRWP